MQGHGLYFLVWERLMHLLKCIMSRYTFTYWSMKVIKAPCSFTLLVGLSLSLFYNWLTIIDYLVFFDGSVSKVCLKCGFSPWIRKIPWRRKWQLTPVFLLGEWSQSDMTEWLTHIINYLSLINSCLILISYWF